MATWQCIKGCGACCYLDLEERTEVPTYLNAAEWDTYLGLIGEDGWCIHLDPINRECRIYDQRPRFCRVSPEVFQALYGVPPEELNDFAIDCCREHIDDMYGDRSLERLRYDQAVSH